MSKDVPRIDLGEFRDGSSADHRRFVELLGDGLKGFGFVKVSNHGIDPDLIDGVYRAHRAFFDLDTATKCRYDLSPGGARGYTPFGREHAKDNANPDLKEFYHIGQELDPEHPYFAEYGANIWPTEIPDMQALSVQLYRGLERVASDLLVALAEYFHLPNDLFAGMMVDGNSILRSIHYPPVDLGQHPSSIRAAAHEDINLITLLIESQGRGLQILDPDGGWMDIHTLDGDIVVDSGDMLARACNDVIPSTTHRVVNPPEDANVSRYSMPFFVHPYSACDLSVIDAFVRDDRPAAYPPITAGAYLQQRLREIGLL